MEALRKAFDDKFPDAASQFDDVDIRRLRENDELATAFLSANDGNVESAIVQIEKSFTFRREMNLNEVTESHFPAELLQKGSVYYRNKDKHGNKVLYFRVKDNIKKDTAATAMVKLYVSYLIEKEHRKDCTQQLVMLFDLTGAGLSNFDSDLVRFIITCFDTYFPKFLAYLLVYDMPFILNAAWKLIRTWLSERAREKVIFVKQNSIQDYINRDQLWSHMGGSDDYEFSYEPPASEEQENMDVFDGSTEVRKRKHTGGSESDSFSNSLTRSLTGTFMLSPQPSNHVSNHVSAGQFRLIVSPSDQLQFPEHEGSRSISLKNPMSGPVAFKVNTTRPQDFRVRPCSGLLQSHEQTDVSVTLKSGGDSSVMTAASARFQILGLQVAPDASKQAAVAQLKTASKESVFETRLGCSVGAKPQPVEPEPKPVANDLSKQISELKKQQQQMVAKMDSIYSLLRILCGLALALLFVHVMGFGFNVGTATSPCHSSRSNSG